MSGIKPVLSDLLAKLATIQVINQDNFAVSLYSHIWNNQIAQIGQKGEYSWPRPAAFIEIISPATFEILGRGLRSADIGIRIHLIHDFFNSEGTMEQDLTIFELRDQVVSAHNNDTSKQSGISGFMPTACTPMTCVSEDQDYDHANLYHYILDFACNFIDSKASSYDSADGRFIEATDPDLDLNVVAGGIPEAPPAEENDYLITP